MAAGYFVDTATVFVAAGDGGNGCSSVRREKFRPLGGPDGGNGGSGGSVILLVSDQVNSLLDVARHPHLNADPGKLGKGSMRAGADGEDLIVPVPSGTVVKNQQGDVIADLVGVGTEFVLADGGRGGLGNAALASKRRKAPGFALLGEPGDQGQFTLELKSVADVALVGYPSAGKSSLIAAISAARPKIADYPFTTLAPNIGIVSAGDRTFSVADVPGLIPGASAGKGLGLEFLRHIERCAVVAHVVDCASLESARDPEADIEQIERELTEFGGLEDRKRIVVLNKIDVPDGRAMAEMVAPSLAERYPVYAVSALTREGLPELKFALAEAAAQVIRPEIATRPRIALTPRNKEDSFDVTKNADHFLVTGPQPERWVRQTDFGNDEAVGFLAERLAKLGVEDRLRKLGAQAGDTVVIGLADAVSFDWQPEIDVEERSIAGPRGTDPDL